MFFAVRCVLLDFYIRTTVILVAFVRLYLLFIDNNTWGRISLHVCQLFQSFECVLFSLFKLLFSLLSSFLSEQFFIQILKLLPIPVFRPINRGLMVLRPWYRNCSTRLFPLIIDICLIIIIVALVVLAQTTQVTFFILNQGWWAVKCSNTTRRF